MSLASRSRRPRRSGPCLLVACLVVLGTIVTIPARPAAAEALTPYEPCTQSDEELPSQFRGQYYWQHDALEMSRTLGCEWGGWYNYRAGRWESGTARVAASANVLRYAPVATPTQITLTFSGGLMQADGLKGEKAKVWWPPEYGDWDIDYRYRTPGTTEWSQWFPQCCSGPFKPFTLKNGSCPVYGTSEEKSCTYDVVWSSLLQSGYYANREWQAMISTFYGTSGQYFDTFYNEWRPTDSVGGAYVVTSFVVRAPNSVEPIVADFTSDEVESSRGTVQFSATASGGKAPLRYFWDYGDSTPTEQGIGVAQHAYAEPGTYPVTLTVKDADNREQAVSHDVVIAAPELHVAVSLPDKDDTTFDPGEETTVRVTVSTTDGLGDLTGLAFTGSPLALSPADLLTVESGPTPAPAGPFTMAPASSKTFDYTVSAGDAVGNVELRSTISGKDAADRTVEADAKITVGVREPLLEVTLTAAVVDAAAAPTNPLEFDLDENDDGAVPREVVVSVTVKNISDADVEDIVIPGELELSSRTLVQPEPFPMSQVTDAHDRDVGTLAPGQTSTVEQFRFEVRDDGRFKVRALVQYSNPSGGPPANLIETGQMNLNVGAAVLLYFDAHVHGPPVRDSGETYRIVGTVENRSTTQTLVLDPLFAQLDGNAGCGAIVRAGSPPAPEGECAIPLFGRLKPGDKVEFHADVVTVVSGGTRSTARFEPGGEILNDDGTRTQLTDDDILVKDGDDEGVRQTTVSLNDGVAVPDGGNPLTWGINFALGIKDSVVAMGMALPELIHLLPELLVAGVSHLPDAASKTGHLLRALLSTTEYIAVSVMAIHEDPEAQASFCQDVVNHFDADLLEEVGMTSGEMAFKMSTFVDNLFVPAQNLLQSGDYDGFARALGVLFGDLAGPDKALKVARAGFRVSTSLLAGASARVERAIQLAEKLPKGPPGLKNLPLEIQALKVGQELGQSTLRKAFGVGEAMAEKIAQFAETNDLIISLRFRQPESLRWIEEFKAVLKPEAIKIKNVDRVDIQFLGYREGDLASVVFKEPVSEAVFEARIANEAENVKKLARARYKTRVKEWNGDFGKNLRKYDELGSVDVGLNYSGNGIGSDIRAGVSDLREFRMTEVVAEDGTTMKVVFMADDNGLMRRITGDIDLVDVRHSNGLPLTAAERADFYEAMQDVIDLQHGETPTWVNGTDFLWEKKAELLNDHTLAGGGEAVAQIAPDRVWRAAFIDPNLSYFDPQGFLTYIWWQGGYRTLESEAYSIGARFAQGVGDLVKYIERPFIPPNKWRFKPKAGPALSLVSDGDVALATAKVTYPPTGLGKCTWRFLDSDAAVVLTVDRSGVLGRWTGTAWVPADAIAADCAKRATLLSLFPQSGLVDAAPAGASVITVAALADFAGGYATAWFGGGMAIVLDPGGPAEETVMVRSVDQGVLTLYTPLRRAHAAGEFVSATTPSQLEMPATR